MVVDGDGREKKTAALSRVLVRLKKRNVFQSWIEFATAKRAELVRPLEVFFLTPSASRPDVEEVKQICVSLGGVGKEQLRGRVWQSLLGVYGRTSEDFDRIASQLTVLPRNPVLCDECKSVCEAMTGTEVELDRAGMETLLVWFITSKSLTYTPGMARKLAPFFLLDLPLFSIYDCFYKFCSQFLPYLLHNDGAKSVNSADPINRQHEELVNHLLYYHDPELAQHLSQCCADWYIAGKGIPNSWFSLDYLDVVDIPHLIYILDQYFITGDTEFSLFIIISIVIKNREELLKCTAATCRVFLTELFLCPLNCKENVIFLCSLSSSFHSKTPKSYASHLLNYDACSTSQSCQDVSFSSNQSSDVDMSLWSRQESKSIPGRFYWIHSISQKTQWEHPMACNEPPPSLFCLSVSVDEVFSHIHRSKALSYLGSSKRQRFFLVDCRALRSSGDIRSGRIPSAYPLDPTTFENPDLMESAFEALSSLKNNAHICLVGHGVSIPPQLVDTDELRSAVRESIRMDFSLINRATLFFQKHGFPFVSFLEGGYSAWHSMVRDAVHFSLEDLAGHLNDRCVYCRYDTILRTGVDPFEKLEENEQKTRQEHRNKYKRNSFFRSSLPNIPHIGLADMSAKVAGVKKAVHSVPLSSLSLRTAFSRRKSNASELSAGAECHRVIDSFGGIIDVKDSAKSTVDVDIDSRFTLDYSDEEDEEEIDIPLPCTSSA